MGSRRAIGFGAILLVLFSVVGKVGAFIASIPDVMVAALLCFMWAMLCALGLSNLRYSATGSSRNSIIVGLALFLSLSVPSYFSMVYVLAQTHQFRLTFSHTMLHLMDLSALDLVGYVLSTVNHFNHYLSYSSFLLH
ncbi:hypothetical protein PR202_gb04150 [Eleusine coracana subsp. coracana]|uniref:Uncharacterized protein n=1 Tax=Eleusine coracana subsp. coracana TaxID=191504 RepID=A0AAV5E3T2_ELECO|nr:hypothetical protein PR202_gb04150 [Eleusine coracana subsp. coracana]